MSLLRSSRVNIFSTSGIEMSSVFYWYPNARKSSRMNISASPTDSSYHIIIFTTWTDFSSIFKDFKYSSFTECALSDSILVLFSELPLISHNRSRNCVYSVNRHSPLNEVRFSMTSYAWSRTTPFITSVFLLYYACLITDYITTSSFLLSLSLSFPCLCFSISCDHIPFLDLMTFFSSDDLVIYLYSSRQRRLSSNLIWSLLDLLLAKIYESSSLLLLWPVVSCRTHSRDMISQSSVLSSRESWRSQNLRNNDDLYLSFISKSSYWIQ